MRDQVMTQADIKQAIRRASLMIVLMCAYVGAGLGLFVMAVVYGPGKLAAWFAGWLLLVPWFAAWAACESRALYRAERAVKGGWTEP